MADANIDWVKVNGQNATVVDGKYSNRVLLDYGVNEISVVAKDKANNRVTKKVTVTAQYDAPVIENLTPSEDLFLSTGASVKIEFDSAPGLDATYLIHMSLTNVRGQVQNATELPMMEQG